ncbi:MAG: amidinotransferase [Nitrospirae bacterium]|nr:MAG: amidinotransferase [Nitrospirota bacterium]
MARLLVCPPDYFGIEYEINPWMRISNAADPTRSRQQWHTLMRVLEEEVGAKLERMPPAPGLPDLVFTANAGVVHEGKAVLSRFRHPERQREEAHFERWFTKQGYQVIRLDPECYFEGAGDLLGFPHIWFGGYRQRSDIRAYTVLSEIFGKEILPLELISPKFYHLDTCFCPLSGGELLYYPPAFDSYAQTTIATHVDSEQRIVVPQAEAERFACNAVCVDRHVVLPAGCPETMKLLREHGYEPHPVELDEFMKAGGAAKCLTLRLE